MILTNELGKLNKKPHPQPLPNEREASPPTPLRKEGGVITEKGNRN